MSKIVDNDIETVEMPVDIANKFRITIDERMISWKLLAERMNINRTYLWRILTKRLPFTENMRKKLNDILETNY